MNQILLLGTAGDEPTIFRLNDGSVMAKFTVGTSKYENGQNKITWHHVVALGSTFDRCAEIKKGSLVFVSGEINLRKWHDETGTVKTVHNILAHEIIVKGETAAAGIPSWNPDEDVAF